MQAFRIFSNCRGTEPPMCNQRCGQPAAGLGPVVSPVEERTLEPGRAPGELARGAQAPLVVRKGVAAFPAVAKWTFEFLAAAAETAATVEEIQTGIAEQGATVEALSARSQPVAAFIRGLAAAEKEWRPPAGGVRGLGPPSSAALNSFPDLAPAKSGDESRVGGRLDWGWLQTLGSDKVKYMTRSTLLNDVPGSMKDAPVRGYFFPRLSYLFVKVWVGPKHTVSGLHADDANNWFTQLRGTKEVVLFPPSAAPLLPFSPKYDYGASVCELNVLHLTDEAVTPPSALADFAAIRGGLYARLGPGDALYIPAGWFHTVVSLTPSLSLNVFGCSPRFLLTSGLHIVLREAAHLAGALGWTEAWGCTCHAHGTPRPQAAKSLAAVAAVAAVAALAAGRVRARVR